MNPRLRILTVAALALPVAAYANAGLPIAPLVGVEIALYLPGLILIECLVLRWALPLSWRQAFECSVVWNGVTTLVGFPVTLLFLFGLLFVLSLVGLDFHNGLGNLGHLYWSFYPVTDPAAPPEWWRPFLMWAMLFWTFVAFVLSVVIEEWLARRCFELKDAGRKRVHRAILGANTVSYIPLWVFTAVQVWI